MTDQAAGLMRARPAVVTPKQLASVALGRLRAAGRARVADRARTFFKPHERIALFGLTAPQVRRLERNLFQQVRRRWTLDDALRFATMLVRDEHLESKLVGVLLLSRHRRQFEPRLLADLERWLAKNWCGNWATTDALCTLVAAPLLRRFPALVRRMRRWTASPNMWVRRAAAVSLTPLARKGEELDVAYAVAAALFGDREDLIHKASGWLLREAGATDPDRLARFLVAAGPKVPRMTMRYAIEKFPAATRRRLLAATREA